MMSKHILAFIAAVALGLGAMTSAQATLVYSNVNQISATDATQTSRLFRNEEVSVWSSSKLAPGTLGTGTHFYDLHNVNIGGAWILPANVFYEVVVTVEFSARLFASAWGPNHIANDFVTNYLGDAGSSFAISTFQVSLPQDSASFQVMVEQVAEGEAGNVAYQVDVYAYQSVDRTDLEANSSVPLPGTVALIGAALLGLAGKRRQVYETNHGRSFS